MEMKMKVSARAPWVVSASVSVIVFFPTDIFGQKPVPRDADPLTRSSLPYSQSKTTIMTEPKIDEVFLKNLPRGFEYPSDSAGNLLMREYGAVFVARGGVTPPKKVVFRDEDEVLTFQASFKSSQLMIGKDRIELQTSAMESLKDAIKEAGKVGLTISPRGAGSARRGYDQTVSFWASRVNPGLAYWVGKKRMSSAEADRIRRMTPYQQVPEILRLEEQKIYFAKDLSKSIIYSVAPPGTSQHLSMLALDVTEFADGRVRAILAKNGWYQTVVSDLPHFTYLGASESKLKDLGLRRIVNNERSFWVPATAFVVDRAVGNEKD